MMAEVQQPHKQHIATLPHTTTSSPVTTTPQQLLQKQHNHSKIIKQKKSHPQDTTSAGWCSSPTLPPAQQLPHRPRSCLMMAEVQQPHKQHTHSETHPISSTNSTRCFFCASLTCKIQRRHCGVVARHAANSVLHLFADFFAHSCRMPYACRKDNADSNL